VGTKEDGQDGLRGYLPSEINRIWSEMETEMKAAKALVFVGYSFPVADLYFSSVLRTVLANIRTSPTIVLVNPDAVAISNRIRTRFSVEKIVNHFNLENFSKLKRKGMIGA
jgi:hypothetical protein